MTLLKCFEADSITEIESKTNAFIKESGQVYCVVNLRVYPPSETVGKWCCYLVYKQKYEEGSK